MLDLIELKGVLRTFLRKNFLIGFFILSHLTTSIAYVSNKNSTDISAACFKFGIIPDYLRIAPLHTLKATYSYGYFPNLGNKIEPKYLQHYPYVILWPFDGKKFYTLILVDLDAPSRIAPSQREWLHYMLGNIPGPAISQGEILAPYIAPDPQPNSGVHRLVYAVFVQPIGRIEFREKKLNNTSDASRAFFSTRSFARKYNLGEPFAVNFFRVEGEIITPDPLETTSAIPSKKTTTFPPLIWD